MADPIETTILMLSHNKAEYVGDAIVSVLNQTNPNFQLWIIDDESDPETRQILARYQNHPKVTIFYESCSPEERRVYYRPSVLLNKYMEQVTSRYLAFLADDDVWAPEFLEKMAGYLNVHVEADVVYCGTEFVLHFPTGREELLKVVPAGILFNARVLPDCRIDGGAILHSRWILDEVARPWYPEASGATNHHVDGLFMNKLARRWTFYPLPEILLKHRVTEKSWNTRLIEGECIPHATNYGLPPGALN